MKEFTVAQLRDGIAGALDEAAKKPVKLVRSNSRHGPRQEYVIMSWKKWDQLTDKLLEARMK